MALFCRDVKRSHDVALVRYTVLLSTDKHGFVA